MPWETVKTQELGSEGGGFRGLALPGCGTSLDHAEPPSALQDYIFYLEPERLESGKGKCPYDPKLDTASALISECPHPILLLQPESVASASGVGGVDPTLTQGAHVAQKPHSGAPPGRGWDTDTPQCELRGRY